MLQERAEKKTKERLDQIKEMKEKEAESKKIGIDDSRTLASKLENADARAQDTSEVVQEVKRREKEVNDIKGRYSQESIGKVGKDVEAKEE